MPVKCVNLLESADMASKQQRRACYRFGLPRKLVHKMSKSQGRRMLRLLIEIVQSKENEPQVTNIP